MAISVVGSIFAGNVTSNSVLTLADVVVPAGCDCMVAGVMNVNTGSAGALLSSAVFNTSENLVEAFDVVSGDFGVALAYLKVPTVTTADLVLTVAASQEGISAGVILLSGVDQATVHRASPGTSNGNSATPSHAVTSVVDDFVIDVLAYLGTGAATEGAGQTQRWNEQGVAGNSGGAGSTEVAAGASTTMSWSITSNPWLIGGASFIPAADGTTPKFYRQRMMA